MFETLAAVGIAAGLVLLLRLIAGPDGDESTILRMFVSTPMPARPRGVQETDLAPFAFRDAQPGAASMPDVRAIERPRESARAA